MLQLLDFFRGFRFSHLALWRFMRLPGECGSNYPGTLGTTDPQDT
jgi:hypothetical protein